MMSPVGLIVPFGGLVNQSSLYDPEKYHQAANVSTPILLSSYKGYSVINALGQ